MEADGNDRSAERLGGGEQRERATHYDTLQRF